MGISEIIKSLSSKKSISIQDLAEKIGMTKSGLYSTMANNSFKVDTLVKISKIFDVPMTVFFIDEMNDKIRKDESTLNAQMESLQKELMTVFMDSSTSWAMIVGYMYEGLKEIIERNKNNDSDKVSLINELELLLNKFDEKFKKRKSEIIDRQSEFYNNLSTL